MEGCSEQGVCVVGRSREAPKPGLRGEVTCLAAPREGLVEMVGQGQGWGGGMSGSRVGIVQEPVQISALCYQAQSHAHHVPALDILL
jgi:hypothetical protein